MPQIPSLNTQNEEWLHKSFFARVAIRDYKIEYTEQISSNVYNNRAVDVWLYMNMCIGKTDNHHNIIIYQLDDCMYMYN